MLKFQWLNARIRQSTGLVYGHILFRGLNRCKYKILYKGEI